ncbi:6-hydroxymethylpterin diphosphokinase MptE-like protein [Sulfitobacter sp. D7]|uniref:6-hydroxymethylpterin diphosphokinase MptE-like protein n=1 Tax=Sulfitobacter sp. D7 TaxID=1968541 RepID=UPI000E779397|nr:6-hydroxymethylpterin diphosphokinase MptE-like protein [Sulfitobacter sp. D7]AYE88256.1 glycosyl transferase family 2 [Sulfitobacter sp. D7]
MPQIFAEKKKVLLFTDSRGQHKPAGQTHDIFAERLAKDSRLDVDLYLCPMKWTTTLDFLEQFNPEKLKEYDAVILYTGIVEWSPRPASSAENDLYDNQNTSNGDGIGANTRDYSRKIVNNKKSIFDKVFGKTEMTAHFSTPLSVIYEGEKTNNMYNLEMAYKVIDSLKSIPNLLFISANRFVSGWEGDFKRGRPKNISITHSYSNIFASELKASGVSVIDLREWSDTDIKKYTCDNIHLTKDGSDYIYSEIMNSLELEETHMNPTAEFSIPDCQFSEFPRIERIIRAKHDAIKKSAGTTDEYLATLVIGARHNRRDPKRLENLKFLLRWIDYHYESLFDVLIIEQDSDSHISLQELGAKEYVRHEFIYNPSEYNRGWCYNVAVKHFCKDAKVVALMDVDVLTGANFLRDVMDCHSRIDVVSPYLNIYYTDKEEANKIMESMSLAHLSDDGKIKNPVTVAGGVVIWNRSSYLAIKGFEQYIGYSCEDRAMDVTIFNHINKDRIRISPQTYVHLYHDKDDDARVRFKEIYGHLTAEYKCQYDPKLGPFDFIHTNCQHSSREKTLELLLARSEDFGDPELYRSGGPLTVNGLRVTSPAVHILDNVVLPPDFEGLNGYKEREVYKSVPEPDRSELAQFHNRYLGKRCFIIGNGPSLNKHDLSLLENEYAFGVNSFYYKTRESGYRPDFYVVEDSSVMKENIEEIRAYDAPFKFFPTIYKNLHPKSANTFFFEMNRGFYEKTSPNYAVPRFSTDATDVLYCGQSVTYINLQLAYFMGFTEVYLIGMDFDYVIPISHKRTGDVLLSDTDDPNHFHKDYFGAGKTWKDPKLDRVLMNYKMADLAFSAVGRKIYNATVGGKLEVFDRVDYETLLRSSDFSGEVPLFKPNSAHTLPNSHLEGAERGSASETLRQIASELLLHPNTTSNRILNGDLKATVETALSQVPAGDPVRLHFQKVKLHVSHASQ